MKKKNNKKKEETNVNTSNVKLLCFAFPKFTLFFSLYLVSNRDFNKWTNLFCLTNPGRGNSDRADHLGSFPRGTYTQRTLHRMSVPIRDCGRRGTKISYNTIPGGHSLFSSHIKVFTKKKKTFKYETFIGCGKMIKYCALWNPPWRTIS